MVNNIYKTMYNFKNIEENLCALFGTRALEGVLH